MLAVAESVNVLAALASELDRLCLAVAEHLQARVASHPRKVLLVGVEAVHNSHLLGIC